MEPGEFQTQSIIALALASMFDMRIAALLSGRADN
jgi:hypothetical protein